MKNKHCFLFLFLWAFGFYSPAQAQWVVDRYEVTNKSKSKYYEKTYNNEATSYDPDYAQNPDEYGKSRPASYDEKAYNNDGSARQIGAGATLSYSGHNTTFDGNGEAILSLNVTPVFKWLGGGEPTDEIIYQESCSLVTARAHSSYDGPYAGSVYSDANPYKGKFFEVELTSPSPFQQNTRAFYSVGYAGWRSQEDDSVVTKLKATGTETRGESRSFEGKVTGSGVTLGIAYYGTPASAGGVVSASYQAYTTRFQLDVSANGEFKRALDKPRDKEIDAYAGKNWTGQRNIGAPIKFFWDGGVGYSANISPDLLGALNNPKYEWDAGGMVHFNENISGDGTNRIPPEEIPSESTPTKSFHHEVDTSNKWEGPTTTTTKVTITGNNPQKSELTAKAKITWYRDPTTRYRSESKFEIIDLDTGEVTGFSPASAGTGDEQELIDAYIAEIKSAKTETFETGQALISVALEGEMMVGSWFVPDATDIVIPVAGYVAGKVYKSVKKLAVLQKALSHVDNLGGNALTAVLKKRRAAGESDRVVIRVVSDVENEGRLGKIPDGTSRADNAEDAAKVKDTKYIGQCFVAGTPVTLADGSLKPIEQIRSGDLVLSRDENTGETAGKRVVQTFERQADATLVLTFSNGERIETTKEHPFFVEGRGFVNAGELGIGTSIVTRAGPSLKVVKSEKKAQPATVYNFEVEGFHTYFVGAAGLWVHNDCLSDIIAAGHAFEKHVLQRGEFVGLEIRTRKQFSDFIDNIIRTAPANPNNVRTRAGSMPGQLDTTAYWDDSTLTIVVYNPNTTDLGTCFRPTEGRAYFDREFPPPTP